MKFSVKNLLAVTLLAALTINGCNTFSQLTELQIQNSKLQSRHSLLRNQTANFEEQKLLYERAFEAAEQRKQMLHEHEKAVDRLAPVKNLPTGSTGQ